MNDVPWHTDMLSNGPAIAGMQQSNAGSNAGRSISRSQDDANVGYFFQRPDGDTHFQNLGTKRWAIGDDSMLEQVRTVTELEREFHGMHIDREFPHTTKKIWEEHHEEKPKQMYSPWTTRDDSTWGAPSDHAVSEPISLRRPGSFPSNEVQNVLSPRSSDTSALGVNMVEYVLGGSPTSKDMVGLNARLKYGSQGGVHSRIDKKNTKTPSPFEGEKGQGDGENKDGILQNGMDDARASGSRQNTPTEDIQKIQHQIPKHEEMLVQQVLMQHNPGGLQIEAPVFEPVGIDPVQFDYNGHMMPPSMDSPGNFTNMDYNQQMMRHQPLEQQQQQQQQQQQPIAVLAPQQFPMMGQQQQQQLGLAPTAFAPTPYVINAQDPYAVGIPIAAATGPTVVPQYIQTPWGLYPANIIQQLPPQGQPGQQQQMGQQQQVQIRAGNQQGRPVTPNQQSQQANVDGQQNNMGNLQNMQHMQAIQQPQYQILTTPAYYDQNGQLVMGNPRGVGTPVRLVSPAPILVNATGQQGSGGALGNTQNPVRMLGNQGASHSTGTVNPQNNSLAYSGSLGYNAQSTNSIFSPGSNNLGLNPQQQGFNNNGLGGLGNSANPGAIGSGTGLNTSGRRDSLGSLYDKRQMPSMSPFYGGISNVTGSPAGPMGLVQASQSLTPPPPGTGISLAPGAEAKYRNGSLSGGGSLFGASSLFPSQPLGNRRTASLSKEVTGRSRLLEDFRNNRIPNLQLKDLVNHVVEFSQDQHGSRFIQQKLERATPAEKAMVFSEILTAAYSLMTDVFGNYVIQKFFEFGSADQKQTLAQRVRGHVLPLALQMYGCRVIQKALESIPPDMQVEIVKELDGHVLKCVKDQNGNHVVQKCIECVDPSHLQFLIDAFKGQIYNLSTHPYGCRVIQRILEHCTPEQTLPILDEIHSQIERLVQDQYGNYVIQHVLEHGRMEDKTRIVAEIRGKVLVLSQHKFASNVVEKCVSHSSRSERAMLIDEVITMNDGQHSALYTMMKDQFANYVVQKMIDVAETNQRKILMHKIRPHVATLRKYTYGKHILVKLEKFFMKNNADLGPIGHMPPNGGM